ncbi:hypothetical protein T4C_3456 [Trichinella pseudospiralis]|uniref:Uncharacterized protein n=1 Tax=Trichinella pseudospiralis TaxID=6337 RepID=A0A0V1ITE5_TRIPS|nr:hypothetical protein T4C_3456 [Trichinella pseudospiralis]
MASEEGVRSVIIHRKAIGWDFFQNGTVILHINLNALNCCFVCVKGSEHSCMIISIISSLNNTQPYYSNPYFRENQI